MYIYNWWSSLNKSIIIIIIINNNSCWINQLPKPCKNTLEESQMASVRNINDYQSNDKQEIIFFKIVSF